MDSARKIHVMNKFRPYLRILQAYNCSNFCNKTSSDLRKSGLFAFSVTIVTIIHISVVSMCARDIYDDKFALNKLGATLPMCTSGVQVVLTLIALIWKNPLICRVIDHLQRIVQKCKNSRDRRNVGWILGGR